MLKRNFLLMPRLSEVCTLHGKGSRLSRARPEVRELWGEKTLCEEKSRRRILEGSPHFGLRTKLRRSTTDNPREVIHTIYVSIVGRAHHEISRSMKFVSGRLQRR